MIKRKQLLIFLVAIFLAVLLKIRLGNFQNNTPVVTQSSSLTISAAISLKDSLNEIKTLYQNSQPNVQITYNFGSSGSLQQQIEQGAPVDIFISAANQQMDALESQNLLLPNSRHTLVKNHMVLITPKDENIVNKFQDLTKAEVTKIALGEPKSVPAGQYGEEVLKYYQILDQVKSKIVYGKDVRQVLTYVETKNVNAGLVYTTDAKTSNQVKIIATVPQESHAPIVYPIAILKNRKTQDMAKAFDQFLISDQAKNIFQKYGFNPQL
jgi:molybdate transport system substrate-binding protein